MMRGIFSSLLFVFLYIGSLHAQDKDSYNYFLKYDQSYKQGDFLNAENYMFNVLNSKSYLPQEYLVAAYNNLGNINNRLGRFKEALAYYNLAESQIINKEANIKELADIYINKAIILGIIKSYPAAIEYFDKGIRIYHILNIQGKDILSSLSTAYLNIGITYLEMSSFNSAFKYFNKSATLKVSNRISGLSLVYLNLAKTFSKIGNVKKAEEYYFKSIESVKIEFGETNYKMAEVYFDYGLFLRVRGKKKEALFAHEKSLSICLKNYGEKHTLVSLSYKHLGDDFMLQNSMDSALYYYQKSLIAIDKNFNNPDIYTNPSIDSSLFDIRLLDNLKSKAQALEVVAANSQDNETRLKTTRSVSKQWNWPFS